MDATFDEIIVGAILVVARYVEYHSSRRAGTSRIGVNLSHKYSYLIIYSLQQVTGGDLYVQTQKASTTQF